MRKVTVVYNPRSGALRSGSRQPLEARLTDLFAQRGVASVLRPFEPTTLRDDVRALVAGKPDALIVVGGDGTVRSVAEHAMHSGVPLGVLPTGTVNVLARDLGVPEELGAAVDAVLSAPVRLMDVARVNGQLFLCGSALAMVPHLGQIRERARDAIGWPLLRLLARGVQILRQYPRMSLRIVVDGHEHTVHTRAIVVSNNPMSPRSTPLPGRDRLDTGRLVVYVTHDRNHWDLLGIAAKLRDGSWLTDRRLRTYQGQTVQIYSSRLRLTSVMNDGEVTQLAMPLRYDIQPRSLAVLAPRSALSE